MESTPAYEEATGCGERSRQQQQQQKQSPLYAATPMTSKPTNDAAANGGVGPNNPFAGYYFNVAQKGKLILPTALWILIIIAGLCFLSMFATLNKTLNTLETLEHNQAESLAALKRHQQQQATAAPQHNEKAKSKHEKGEHKHHHHHHHDHDKHVKEPKPAPVDDLITVDSFVTGPVMQPPPLSWFKLPDWTSLEPRPRPKQVVGPMQLLDRILGDHPDHMNKINAPLSSSSIIIESDSPMSRNEAMNLFDSVMQQISGIFGNSKNGGDLNMFGPQPQQPIHRHEVNNKDDKSSSKPLISANIDKVEINVDSGRRDDEEEPTKKPTTREEDINSLEKSVNDLVAKLIDGPDSSGPEPIFVKPGHHKHPHKQQNDLPFEPSARPSMRPMSEGPLSPLASLLMPPIDGNQPPLPLLDLPPNSEMPSIIIAMGDLENVDDNGAKLEGTPMKSQIIDLGPISLGPMKEFDGPKPFNRPSFKPASPYEFSAEPEMMQPKFRPGEPIKPGQDPVFDAIAEEMAGPMLGSIVPMGPMFPFKPLFEPQGQDKVGADSIESLPVVIPPKAFFPPHPMEHKPPTRGQQRRDPPPSSIGDLFNMFFGPPPESKLVVAPPKKHHNKVEVPIDESKEVGKMQRLKESNSGEDRTETETTTPKPESIIIIETTPATDDDNSSATSPIASPVADASASTTVPPVENTLFTSTPPPSGSVSSPRPDGDGPEVGHLLDNLFTNVFSLPQFKDQQAPINVEAQSKDKEVSESELQSKTKPESISTTVMPDQSLTANTAAPPQQQQQEQQQAPSTTRIPETFDNNSNKVEILTSDKVATNNGQSAPAATAAAPVIAENITPPVDQTRTNPTIKEETSVTTSPINQEAGKSIVEVLNSPPKTNTADSGQNQLAPAITTTTTTTTTNANDRFIDTTSPLPGPPPTQGPSAVGPHHKESPLKNFLHRADKFVERNLVNLKKLLAPE